MRFVYATLFALAYSRAIIDGVHVLSLVENLPAVSIQPRIRYIGARMLIRLDAELSGHLLLRDDGRANCGERAHVA